MSAATADGGGVAAAGPAAAATGTGHLNEYRQLFLRYLPVLNRHNLGITATKC